jgi:response regulator RpfG family c-di-GMP phosphodiesterase
LTNGCSNEFACRIENRPKRSRPILIVDDEEIVLVALRDTLLREGYNIVASPHAIHALSVLKAAALLGRHHRPANADGHGLEFLAQVREIQPDATRILITAVLSLSTVIDAINKGEIYRFIVKPWLREELLATVKNAVQRYELISRNARLQAATQAMNRQLEELNLALEVQVARVAEQNAQLQEFARSQEENLRRSVELCVQTMRTFYPTLGNQARRVAALCQAMADGSDVAPRKSKPWKSAATSTTSAWSASRAN